MQSISPPFVNLKTSAKTFLFAQVQRLEIEIVNLCKTFM